MKQTKPDLIIHCTDMSVCSMQSCGEDEAADGIIVALGALCCYLVVVTLAIPRQGLELVL